MAPTMRIALVIAALAAAGCAQQPIQPRAMDDAQSLAAAETAFAAQSVREDMRAAFLAHFADDAHAASPRSAYAKHGSERMRFYRNDLAPALGKGAALASPGMTDEKLAWVLDRTEIARSRDFGYARGSYAALAAPQKPLGYFLRVWRFERGEWRIVMDVTNPAPKA